jgi:hypothetical protein
MSMHMSMNMNMNMNMNMHMSMKHISYDCSNSETVISQDNALHVFRHGLLPKHAAASTTSSPQPCRRLKHAVTSTVRGGPYPSPDGPKD